MRKQPRRTSRFSQVFVLLALTTITGLAITATSAGATGVRFGFVDSVASWFGGGGDAGGGGGAMSGGGDDLWQDVPESSVPMAGQRQIVPESYRVLRLNQGLMKQILATAPPESEKDSVAKRVLITIPLPDGSLSRFRIFESSIMEQGLADKFPELKTYAGQGVDDPAAIVRFDYTPEGFHALILRPEGSVFIDPYAKGNTDNYISYLKRDFDNPNKQFECLVGTDAAKKFEYKRPLGVTDFPNIVSNGGTLRTYRLAMAATGEYTATKGGTVAGALAGITTTMNRVNAVYERDLSVRMVLIANNNLIVYTNGATDPYTNNSGGAMLGENQTNIDTVIGTANYDIGHVFSTGGGGIATLNSPCNAGSKARGVTGSPAPVGDPFDIDYVAHEIGHQFGGNHTFNTTTGSCAGGRASSAAFEPGSGATIQAYAGICLVQNLQRNSDDYFHIRSLEEMVTFISGTACDAETATGNSVPVVTAAPACTIPRDTPFELTGSAVDVNGDSLTYTWEEYDLGAASNTIPNTDASGGALPIFRSYKPTSTGATRYFPSLPFILNNANVPPSTFAGTNSVGTVCSFGNCLTGELLPTITRTMQFQMTARDNRAGGGSSVSAQTAVTVDAGSGPFVVTAPNTAVSYIGNNSQTVTWNVANTTAAPVSCATVNILLSTDGGLTFPTTLLAGTPNDGSQIVTIPNTATTTARLKIQCATSCFFDISNTNFTIVPSATRLIATTGSDMGDCISAACSTITHAIGQAIAGDTISIAAGTYTESGITVNKNLTITGAGAPSTIVQANAAPNTAANRVFSVNSGVTASISGLTIRHGQSSIGGGIFNQGTLTITNSTISNNSAPGFGGSGGGINNTDGTLTVANSTISNNYSATGGGGILNGGSSSVLTVTNSTVSNNSVPAGGIGGGIYSNNGTSTVTNSTISGNSASFGGGIFQTSSTVNSHSSIIAGNTATTSGPDFLGTLTSQGYNLIGNTSNTTISGDLTGNQLNVNPLLAPLGNYGGPTRTHALLSASPAVNAGTSSGSPLTDQRGASRLGNVDIGAFELNGTGGTYIADLPNALVNTSYNYEITADNGSFTYSVTSGSLPNGMSLNTSVAPAAVVALSGTPTLGGIFNFAITASNGPDSNVTNYRIQVFGPTAANVSVGGRVLTADGFGVRNAIVTLTKPNGETVTVRTGTFGYYRFDDVEAGQTYIIGVLSKRYVFTPRVINVSDELTDLEMIAEPEY